MNTLILFWYLACSGGMCETVPFKISREAMAIASCESGDGHNFGTFTLRARSHTADGGIWQFNDKTYLGLTGRTHADTDDPNAQYDAFVRLWNDGKGWRHWKASQKCWSQWMTIDGNRAVWIER